MIERNKILFISFIAGLSVMIFFLFVLFILNILSNTWGSQSDILIASFTCISTIAIVLTAYWAKKSFWFTDRKDKIDRTLYYIKKLSSEKTSENLYFIAYELPTTLLDNPNKLSIDQINKKIHHILRVLEEIGMLLKRDYVDIELLYDWFSISLEEIMPNLNRLFKSQQSRGIKSQAWENVRYLEKRFNEYKS